MPKHADSVHLHKVKKESKEIAAKFGLKWIYSPQSNRLLRLLGEGYSQSEIAKKLHISKQRVNYWASKANKQGLVTVKTSIKLADNRETSQFTSGSPIIYDLTALGKVFLTGSERGFREPVTLEDYAMKFPLVKDRSCLDWKKLGQPNNWVKLGVQLGGSVSVEKCLGKTPNVIIHTGQLSGFDSEALFVQAGGIIFAVKSLLLDKGLELGDVGIPLRDPNVKMFTPEAVELHEKYGNIITPEAVIDNSPPERIPHEERNRRQQRGYLEIPERIKCIEDAIIHLESDVERMCATQEKSTELMARILSPEKPTREVAVKGLPGRLYE